MNKPVMKRPNGYIENNMQYVDSLKDMIGKAHVSRLKVLESRTQSLEKLIRSLSHENVLSRGFAIVQKDDEIVTSADEVKKGDSIRITMKDGTVSSTVTEVN